MTLATPTGRPLLSFVLISYDQAQYIREAVEGAFAQTYSPLEIILSDDSSTDCTFDIMRDMAGSYDGPHKILLNQNERNLGVCRHINRALRLSKGEIIIPAAGDDVSLPRRCEAAVKSWHEDGPWVAAYSQLKLIDMNGKSLGRVMSGEPEQTIDLAIRNNGVRLRGASHVWHRSIFDTFGDLPTGTRSEDKIVMFRALLMGKVQFINEPLVLYRRHPGTLSGIRIPRWSYRRFIEHQKTAYGNQRRFLEVNYGDLMRALDDGLIPVEAAGAWSAALERRLEDLAVYLKFLDSSTCERRELVDSFSPDFEVPRIERWLRFLTLGEPLGILAYYFSSLMQRLTGVLRRLGISPPTGGS